MVLRIQKKGWLNKNFGTLNITIVCFKNA